MYSGSLINNIYNATKPLQPQVGMGATELCYTDRHAYTIIEVSKSGKRIKVQRDKVIRVDKNGQSDSQEYKYERDPKGGTVELSLRKDGRWKMVKYNYPVFAIGRRDEYYDYSF